MKLFMGLSIVTIDLLGHFQNILTVDCLRMNGNDEARKMNRLVSYDQGLLYVRHLNSYVVRFDSCFVLVSSESDWGFSYILVRSSYQ